MQPSRKLRHAPKKQIDFVIPVVISGRLDALLAIAESADEPTTRQDLIAAVILSAEWSSTELAAILKRYRTAKVADAFIPGHDPKRFVKPVRRQGPRRRSYADDAGAAEGDPTPRIRPDDSLQHSPPYRIGVAIPRPLDRRLDSLVASAESAGEKTTRKELFAALILDAKASEDNVARMLLHYRRAPMPKSGRGVRRPRSGRGVARRRPGPPKKDD